MPVQLFSECYNKINKKYKGRDNQMEDTYLKSKKILIVDDEESLRKMLITIL